MPEIKDKVYSKSFKEHKQRFGHCENCGLHQWRQRIVLYRGEIPCDVLFVGEAPGKDEDAIGVPFCGPSGKLLDWLIGRVKEDVKEFKSWSYGITNTIACIPWFEEKIWTGKGENYTTELVLDDPCHSQLKACQDRLDDIITLANPKIIVSVGKVAGDWLHNHYKGRRLLDKVIEWTHPSSILRANEIQKDYLMKKNKVVLRDAILRNL